MRRIVITAGCVAAALALFAASVAAQTGVLSGVIYDQSNKTGLAGAEIRIKGTELVATTGKDGRFTIANVPAGTREIEAIREGYRPFRLPLVKIAAADTAHVYLALSAAPVERPSDAELDPALRERLSKVTQRLERLGEATTTTSLGEVSENAPLYVIDGIVLSKGMIPKEIDANRIESIEVIKGAAAESLYGQRAANGVIVIRTKRDRH